MEKMTLGEIFDFIKNSNLENKEILEASLSSEITKLNTESKDRKLDNKALQAQFDEFKESLKPLFEKTNAEKPEELISVVDNKDKELNELKEQFAGFEGTLNEWKEKFANEEKAKLDMKHDSLLTSAMNKLEYGKDDPEYHLKALKAMSELKEDGAFVGEQTITDFLQERIDKSPKINNVKEVSETVNKQKAVEDDSKAREAMGLPPKTTE